MFLNILSLFIVAQFASAAIDNKRNVLAFLNFGQAHFNAKQASISISIQRTPEQTSSTTSTLPDDCLTSSNCYQSTGASTCPIQNTTREYYSIDVSRIFTRHTCPAGQIFDSSTCQCSCDPFFEQADAIKATRCQQIDSAQFTEASYANATQFWTIEQDGCTYAPNAAFCPSEQLFVADRCSCGCPSAPANESQSPCCDFDVTFGSPDLTCLAHNGQFRVQSSIDVSYYYELLNAANCSGAQRRQCPDGYFFSLGNCSCQILWVYPYFLINVPLVRNICQSFGGDLYAPRSVGELVHLTDFINIRRYSTYLYGDYFWLGQTYNEDTGKWQYIDNLSDVPDGLGPDFTYNCYYTCPECSMIANYGFDADGCYNHNYPNMPLCYSDSIILVPQNPYDNKWFTVTGDSLSSFDQLQQACAAANDTASVAMLKTDEQILSFINYQKTELLSIFVTIGLHKVNNVWQWGDGTLLSDQSWKLWNVQNSSADNDDDGDCVYSNFKWTSYSCAFVSNFPIACMLP